MKNSKLVKLFSLFAITYYILNISGCSSANNNTYYYLLNGATDASQKIICNQDCKFIQLKDITMPDFLQKQGIAYMITENQIQNVDSRRWGTNLGEQLSTIFMNTTLKQHSNIFFLNDLDVAINDPLVMNIKINSFNGSYDGYAYVTGTWILSKDNTIISSGSINSKKALDDDGYDALVKALSEIWQEESNKISSSL